MSYDRVNLPSIIVLNDSRNVASPNTIDLRFGRSKCL